MRIYALCAVVWDVYSAKESADRAVIYSPIPMRWKGKGPLFIVLLVVESHLFERS